MEITVNLKDWSTTPGARNIKSGKYSAEEYYIKVLGPAVEDAYQSYKKLTLNLDGTAGIASSFLDEIAQRIGSEVSWNWLYNKLKIISTEEPEMVDELRGYITDHWMPY